MAVEMFAGESKEIRILIKDSLGVELDPSTLNNILVYTSWEHTKEAIAQYSMDVLAGYRSCEVSGNYLIFRVESSDTASHDIGNIRVLIEIHRTDVEFENGIEVSKKAATLIRLIK